MLRFGLSRDNLVDALDDLADRMRPVGIDVQWRPVAHDPDDDHLIETAIYGGVSTIASFNVPDLREPAALFRMSVVRPTEILRSV